MNGTTPHPPTPKPRGLTPTPDPKSQSDSLFLTMLLPEIRFIIYEYVFGHRNLHIFIYEQKLVSLFCQNPTAAGLDGHEACIGMSMSQIPGTEWWKPEGIRERLMAGVMHHNAALLTTCRTIYHESIDVLYETHVLHFSNLFAISAFPQAFLPHHLHLLRHIRLSLTLFNRNNVIHAYFNNAFSRSWPGWDGSNASGGTPWQCAWSAVGGLKSLQTLLVTLEVMRDDHQPGDLHWSRSMPEDFETAILEPMKQVVCEDFLLRVNWPSTGNDFREYPFRIEHVS
ncbi:hypothetical protein M426DRAFT_205344 [Hypoxylon sp. CI-4A]|nr:hypothetical protein M426DRAFT_205344 [Hypoxylon sp. CI-4A]